MAGLKTLGFAASDHDPRSWELYRFLADMDYKHGDRFCFKAGGDGDNGEQYRTEESAIKRWNRRAERTCRIERVSTPYHRGPARCSVCMMPLEPLVNYCPHCGARVVSD